MPEGMARRVKLVVLDVDGVLTDNGIYVGAVKGERVEFKRFHAQDGLGVHLLRLAGLPVVWLTGRVAAATALRADELRIDEVIQDETARKYPACCALLERRGLAWDEVLYMGDDLADVPVLRRVGVPVSVPNASTEARAAARWVTTLPGGQGAVREMSEALLRARGEWEEIRGRYYRERGDALD
jgi:3-deoxy-D-manno-octulosonate 8-phosphate phosphatase (KDO 8-P phosphatase)